MQLLTLAPDLLTFVVSLADEVPDEEDVKAGWLAFAIFIGLILLAALVIGAVFLINQNRNDAIKTDAITDAAKSVEKGADKVGAAAEKAGDAVSNAVR